MHYQEYKQYMMETISKTTPKYIQRDMVKKMIACGIAIEGKNYLRGQMTLEDLVVLSDYPEDEKLLKCLESNERALKVMEEWEFTKSYRYSAIFNFEEYTEENLTNLLSAKKAKLYSSDVTTFDEIKRWLDNPTIYMKDSVTIFKFSYGKEYFDQRNGELCRIKYPILAVLYNNLNILEIRLDTATRAFKSNNEFYAERVKESKLWLESNLNIKITEINMRNIIEEIIEQKQDEVVVASQSMWLKQGGRATLNIGGNKNYVLPILGELKLLIASNQEIFDCSPIVRDILEEFIESIEETSDLPRITLYWKKEDISVEFIHNYKEGKFTLLQYFGEQEDMERMNYVTNYLISNRKVDQG